MSDLTHSEPTPASTDAGVPFLPPEATTALDAHGHDPAEYDWIPVRRKPRVDGWSPEKQRLFIATVADTGSVTGAARVVGMSAKSAYALRRAPDGASFDRAWTAAIRQAMGRLVDVCLERALNGTEEAIHNREGHVIGHRTKYHDRMAMFLLRAHMPELFREAHKADRAKGEALPPPPEPVADALKRIDPVPPTAPDALMHPDDLDIALQTADALDGKLPRWRRDPDLLAREEEAARLARPDPGPLMGEQFERDLAAAKAGTWRAPPKKRKPVSSRR